MHLTYMVQEAVSFARAHTVDLQDALFALPSPCRTSSYAFSRGIWKHPAFPAFRKSNDIDKATPRIVPNLFALPPASLLHPASRTSRRTTPTPTQSRHLSAPPADSTCRPGCASSFNLVTVTLFRLHGTLHAIEDSPTVGGRVPCTNCLPGARRSCGGTTMGRNVFVEPCRGELTAPMSSRGLIVAQIVASACSHFT